MSDKSYRQLVEEDIDRRQEERIELARLRAEVERLKKIEAAARNLGAGIAIPFEDERLNYIEVQLDRKDLEEFRAALGEK